MKKSIFTVCCLIMSTFSACKEKEHTLSEFGMSKHGDDTSMNEFENDIKKVETYLKSQNFKVVTDQIPPTKNQKIELIKFIHYSGVAKNLGSTSVYISIRKFGKDLQLIIRVKLNEPVTGGTQAEEDFHHFKNRIAAIINWDTGIDE